MQKVVVRLDTEGMEATAVEIGYGATTSRISPRNAKRIQDFADHAPITLEIGERVWMSSEMFRWNRASRMYDFPQEHKRMKKYTPPSAQVASVEILSDSINYVVLKSAGRNFPGMVIQGDSLAKLYRCASEICRLANQSGDEELRGEATALSDELGDHLAHYEQVLSAYGIELPYASPIASKAAK